MHNIEYTPTHQSFGDGSLAMWLGPDAAHTSGGMSIYMNENGDLFSSDDDIWAPIDPAPIFVDSVATTVADWVSDDAISGDMAMLTIKTALDEFFAMKKKQQS